MVAKWQDWASFALGLWLAVSPWIAGYAEHDAATANAIMVGLALALGSHFECVACDEMPAEWLNLAAGVWLVCAPFVLGFTHSALASTNSVVVGGLVAALAASALSLDKHIGKLWHKAQ
jgi:SPW repeat